MRHTIQLKITDSNGVLTDLDIYQIECMVDLRLSPWREHIGSVDFDISRMRHDQWDCEHLVRTTIHLRSGKVIDSTTTRFSKGAALIASTDRVKDLIERRMDFESGWLYRVFEGFRTMVRGLIESPRMERASIRGNQHRSPTLRTPNS